MRVAAASFTSRILLGLASLMGVLLVPEVARSTSFSTPLDDLIGPVDFIPATGGREASFDFGQPFASIQNVWIEVEATVRAREFDVCGTTFDPQPCVHEVQLLGVPRANRYRRVSHLQYDTQ